MGERYFFNCPNCGRELYFGNWTNYTEKCFCGKCFIVVHTVNEITEAEMEKIREE
jgi:hypothetical protein